jgi:1-acyl-sn-glycerol-3-phosphate acyltransferase
MILLRPSSALLIGAVRLLVGAYPRWIGGAPNAAPSIYFANHTSHMDTVALWAALPAAIRVHAHPVAALDYWGKGLKRYIATKALKAVLIDRTRGGREGDPLEPLAEVLVRGESIIIFPEGTRGTSAVPAPFKSGLFHLATRFPHVRLVPVYLENLHRSMPKGAHLPVPMICMVRFGAPMARVADEAKDAFLERARAAVAALGGVAR